MSIVLYLISASFIIILIKFFFFTNKRIEEEIVDIIVENDIEEKEVEKVYQLNASPIKLSFYPLSKFNSFYTRNLYQRIIINRCWINEPFHTKFVKLLYIADANILWIKSKKTKEIVLNIRGINQEELKATSFKVLDLKAVMQEVVMDIVGATNKLLSQQQREGTLLSVMVYVLSKTGNIDMICQDIDIENIDESDLANCIINTFFSEISNDSKKNMHPMNNLNYEVFVQIFEENIAYAREYPNTVYMKDDTEKMLDKIQYLPKKQLTSIE